MNFMGSNSPEENNPATSDQDFSSTSDPDWVHEGSEEVISPSPDELPADEITETQPVPHSSEETSQRKQAAAEDSPADQNEVTQPMHTPGELPPPDEDRKTGRSWFFWAAIGILTLLIIAALSAFGGYRSAIGERNNYKATQIAGDAETQFLLGMEDIEEGRYDLARQRFEYIIRLDPAFPGIQDRLAEVLLELRTTATPTSAPTPTLTPTPDLRGRDELYDGGRSMLMSGDWSNAIETLLTLRKRYPDHNAVKVDGMLYVALRNRGVDKIALEADLEGGMYDLTLAEKFGPLDAEARNWRSWAELYRLGAGFWDIDWGQAVYYFSQLAPAAPNLRDGSGLTARDRYRDALLGYGDWLVQRGEWCLAAEQYQLARELNADPEVEPTASFASEQCEAGVDQPPGELPETGTPLPPSTEETQPPTPPPAATPYP
jgi:tetratricopeptide (TPR) repeat protein